MPGYRTACIILVLLTTRAHLSWDRLHLELGDPVLGLVRTVDSTGKQGFRSLVNDDSRLGSFDEAQDYNSNRAIVRRDGKWYIIDPQGNDISSGYDQIVLPPDTTVPIPVQNHGYWEYFIPLRASNTSGRFDKLYHFTGDYGIARKSDSSYVIDRSGEINSAYPGAWYYLGMNWLAHRNENTVHLMTTNGKRHSDSFEEIYPFKAGFAIAKVSQGWTLLDTTGAILLTDFYPMLLEGQASFVRMVSQGGMGIINVLGEVILPPTFSEIRFLDTNLVAVRPL